MRNREPYWTADGTRVTPAQIRLLRRLEKGISGELRWTQTRSARRLKDLELVEFGDNSDWKLNPRVYIRVLVGSGELLRGSWADLFE